MLTHLKRRSGRSQSPPWNALKQWNRYLCAYTYLQCLEHMAERLYPDQEVANDHRRTEVRPAVERLLAHTLKVGITGARRLFTCGCECPHGSSETNEYNAW